MSSPFPFPSHTTTSSGHAQHDARGAGLQPAVRARPVAVFALEDEARELIYAPREQAELAGLADFATTPVTRATWEQHRAALREVEVIFSGWGAPVMDEHFLAALPRLRAVFYGAGSVRYFTTDAFWARDIAVTSAYAANAVPVAEYTLGVALLGLKHFWRFADAARRGEAWGDHTRPMTGAFRSTIGLVSFGMVARRCVELLRSYDLRALVYCPFLGAAEAAELGVERASLEEIFATADVVSIHTPLLPETVGLVTGRLVAAMKPGATLINTARGAVVNQPELVAVLRERPDLTAVLDVTEPEPLPRDAELLRLPNVIVTPHIAGSHGRECARMGRTMVDEFRRYLAGEPLRWQITREMAASMA